MGHPSLFRELEENSYKATHVVRLDDGGDLPFKITHWHMIDDDDVEEEDEEYVIHMHEVDATIKDSEDDELDNDNEADGGEEEEAGNEAIM